MSKKSKCPKCGKKLVDVPAHIERVHTKYEMKVNVNGEDLTFSGNELEEVFNEIDVPVIKTMAKVRIETSDRDVELIWSVNKFKHILNNPTAKEVEASRLERILS